MRKHPHVEAICGEFGVRIIDKQRYPEPGETRAVETLARIMRRHGEGHLRLVLTTLAETENNKGLLDEVLLWATSDLVRACGNIVETRAGDWLTCWDAMPVGELQFVTQELSGTIPQRYALAGMLYERIIRVFGPGAAQPDLFDDRRRP